MHLLVKKEFYSYKSLKMGETILNEGMVDTWKVKVYGIY
jgi:hypothetical protein